MTAPAHVTPCAACEVGTATLILPSGAPVCPDYYMALSSPEAMHLTDDQERIHVQR